MTKKEIKKALLDGKKLRLPVWEEDEFIFFNYDTLCVMDEKKQPYDIVYCSNAFEAGLYEIYEEPILDTHGNDLKKNDICFFFNEPDEYKVVGIFRRYKDGYYHGYASYGFQIETKHLYCEKINLDELR